MVLLGAPGTGCSGSSVVARPDLEDAANRALSCPENAPIPQPNLTVLPPWLSASGVPFHRQSLPFEGSPRLYLQPGYVCFHPAAESADKVAGS